MNTLISEFLATHRLPESFEAGARETYIPLAERVAHWQAATGGPLGLALNGGQGTGKSTLAAFLNIYLGRFHGLRVAVLSLDDLYLTRVEREALGAQVHPLLATRGVPGTHDLGIGMDVASACLNHESKTIQSPVFKKENDDRAPQADWHTLTAPLDVLILEGWCVGAIPEPEAALVEPLNDLERDEDAEGVWRQYVNQKLKMEYQKFFSLFPRRVLLKAPGFDSILNWRRKQERKLRETLGASGSGHAGLMDDAAVARFIMHYERLTRWMLAEMPARVDACIHLNEAHGVERLVLQDDG
ncbi:MAG: kinase [Verrucomicrobia bacterium]|nr:kinase [Verrucomicrobiota bacterium]